MTAIQEGAALLSRLGAALYKGILRSALERARQGDDADLVRHLPRCRAVAQHEASEAAATEERERARIVTFARGKDPADLAREHAKLRREQDAGYRRWTQRRPDERTARKARLSNALDGRAGRMAQLAAAYEHLTGKPMPTETP